MSVELLGELKQLHARGGSKCGICHSVGYQHELDLIQLFKRWPKYSGSIVFPMPGGMYAYNEASLNNTLWDRNTEYGQLRWELLEWLIEELQK